MLPSFANEVIEVNNATYSAQGISDAWESFIKNKYEVFFFF